MPASDGRCVCCGVRIRIDALGAAGIGDGEGGESVRGRGGQADAAGDGLDPAMDPGLALGVRQWTPGADLAAPRAHGQARARAEQQHQRVVDPADRQAHARQRTVRHRVQAVPKLPGVRRQQTIRGPARR
nr:hypothetical protein [Luteimonas granuli]